jgi:DNA-binding transcriptional regulator YhcF (GntR family)
MDFSIDPGSAVPPFEQLRSQIATRVASGELPAGTRLAPVRRLAAELGLAANTVARAYRELEADGVVATHGRGGTLVSSAVLSGADEPALAEGAESYVRSARQQGLTLAEALALVERAWSRAATRPPS